MRELLRVVLAFCILHFVHPAAGSTNTVTLPSSGIVGPVTSVLEAATCRRRNTNSIADFSSNQCLRRTAADKRKAASGLGSSDRLPTGTALSAVTEIAQASGASRADSEGIIVSPSASKTPSVASEDDAESPLDNVNFLSFEEWKKQNLAKSGQSAEHVANRQNVAGDRPRPGIHHALDLYGDEGEIKLEFTGFGGATGTTPGSSELQPVVPSGVPREQPPRASHSRDAGKTCKERTNYASFDCAATMLKTNPECKSASSILVEHKDSYMLNTCSVAHKFLIVELCEEILVDTVVLANYEFFSSSFRHFRVSVSDRYPVKLDKWRDLGTFEARNVREIQAFLVERPQIWARYLRVEFLSHYGNEYYCPVSLLRIHGITMMEDYRRQEEIARGEGDDEGTQETESLDAEVVQVKESSPGDPGEGTESVQEVIEGMTESAKAGIAAERAPNNATDLSWNASGWNASMLFPEFATGPEGLTCAPIASPVSQTHDQGEDSTSHKNSTAVNITNSSADLLERTHQTEAGSVPLVSPDKSTATYLTTSGTKAEPDGTLSSVSAISSAATQTQTIALQSSPVASSVPSSRSNSGPSKGQSEPARDTPVPANSTKTHTNSTRAATSPPHSQPTTQESFFKSVHKRLQQLESNSSLSLQYIESQSLLLREAFTKVEKRQIATATSFLSSLNETVTAELRGFRDLYDELWQSTIAELQGQRDRHQREMLAMSSRLSLVADELVWQKRMGIAQSTLLLLCLALVLFARHPGPGGYIDMPIMQSMVNRSSAALGWESPSRSPVSLFRHKIWGSSSTAGDWTEGHDSRPVSQEVDVEVVLESPTPPFEDSAGEPVDAIDEGALDSALQPGLSSDLNDSDYGQPRSAPATPNGTREREEFEVWDPGVWSQRVA